MKNEQIWNCKVIVLLVLVNVFMVATVCAGSMRFVPLKEVRFGEHQGFTRVVFEFPETVSLSKQEIVQDKKLSLVIDGAQLTEEASVPDVAKSTGRIENMELVPDASGLHVNMDLSEAPIDYTIRTLKEEGRIRVVIDMYWIGCVTAGTDNVLVAPKDLLKNAETEKSKEINLLPSKKINRYVLMGSIISNGVVIIIVMILGAYLFQMRSQFEEWRNLKNSSTASSLGEKIKALDSRINGKMEQYEMT